MPAHGNTTATVRKLYTCSREEAVHVLQSSHTGNIHILSNLSRPLVSLHCSQWTLDSRKEPLSRQASALLFVPSTFFVVLNMHHLSLYFPYYCLTIDRYCCLVFISHRLVH